MNVQMEAKLATFTVKDRKVRKKQFWRKYEFSYENFKVEAKNKDQKIEYQRLKLKRKVSSDRDSWISHCKEIIKTMRKK